MSEFKIIETQEQLDAVIGERISRAEKKAAEKAIEKFADYDDVKTKNAEYEKTITELREQLGQKEADAATIAELETRVHQYEIGSVKTRIALESGLPYELAEKLSGTTEDEIRADAQTMAKFVVNQRAPIGSNEPDAGTVDPFVGGLKSLASELGKE